MALPAPGATLSCIELCAGGGGMALGLERAGFDAVALVENDPAACQTLRLNRPNWPVIEDDVRQWTPPERPVDLLAGGVPCSPFTMAGTLDGHLDDRDLFPRALDLVAKIKPRAVLFENVPNLMTVTFIPYRRMVSERLAALGFQAHWLVMNASDFGVPQHRSRLFIVGIREDFSWPEPKATPRTVAGAVGDLMASRGWPGAVAWSQGANTPAPTLVGGSKKHNGGPDLGPTRSRRAWAALGIDGRALANEPPGPDFEGQPRLTLRMTARIQGFPDDWSFVGGKGVAYRQIGNALPPAVACGIGQQIRAALLGGRP